MTAVQLMRSRFTAFTKSRMDYVGETQLGGSNAAAVSSEGEIQWQGLVIHESIAGQATDEEGWVTFTATYQQFGEEGHMTEKSYFCKQEGQWVYVQAKSQTDFSLPSLRLSKPGRNDPCPCGSNRKYKRCCMK